MLESWGNLDRATPPAARLRYWRDDAYTRMRLFFVRVDGRMVARSWIRCELQENLGSALLHVDVLNDFTGRGIGRALLDHAEALAAADGRTILMTFTEHPADFDADGPDVLRPATGTGALPASARGVRFAAARGLPAGAGGAVQLPRHAAGSGTCWTPWSGRRWPRRSTTSWSPGRTAARMSTWSSLPC